MIHGTTHAYNKGCRCDPCKKAKSDANKELRSKQEPKSGKRGRKPRTLGAKILRKRGRPKKQVSAWAYTVIKPKEKPSVRYDVWDFTVKRKKVKSVGAWDFTVKIPKRLMKIKAKKPKPTLIKLSTFETSLDVIQYAKNRQDGFNQFDVKSDVTDLSLSKIFKILFDLVGAGYLVFENELFLATEKTSKFGELNDS